uniref:Uncharacterized protein n=1 Tax=Mola mola TaxID=94237 RepID=A0A3Q3WZC8_MOLML
MSGRPITVRLVFLGAAGVGKTALIHRFLHDRFERTYTRTVEELHVQEYDVAGSGKMLIKQKPLKTVEINHHFSPFAFYNYFN